jgi:hypothetical protein
MPKRSKIYKFFAKEWHTKWMEQITQRYPNFDKTKHDMRLFKICYTKEIRYEDAIQWFWADTYGFWKMANKHYIHNARYGIVCENDCFICMEYIHTYKKIEYSKISSTYTQHTTRDKNGQFIVDGFYFGLYDELRRPEKYPNMVDAEMVHVESCIQWLFLMWIYEHYKNTNDFAWTTAERVFANDYLIKCMLQY